MTNRCPLSGKEMPLSLTADRVSQRPGDGLVKQPSVVNSETANAIRSRHGGGGGGGGPGGGVAATSIVRVMTRSWAGDASSRMRTRTTWGPVVVKVFGNGRVVSSSKLPSSSLSHA